MSYFPTFISRQRQSDSVIAQRNHEHEQAVVNQDADAAVDAEAAVERFNESVAFDESGRPTDIAAADAAFERYDAEIGQ